MCLGCVKGERGGGRGGEEREGGKGIIGEKEGRAGERGNEGGKEERERGMEERGEKRHKYQEASLELGNGEGEGGWNFINGLTSHLSWRGSPPCAAMAGYFFLMVVLGIK